MVFAFVGAINPVGCVLRRWHRYAGGTYFFVIVYIAGEFLSVIVVPQLALVVGV